MAERSRAFTVADTEVPPGSLRSLEIPVARLPTGTWVQLPIAVAHGARPGPKVWINAAIHGDELNGVEIVRRVLGRIDPRTMRGTLIAAPIVNVFGFLSQDRYLPDRRDLNRSFPGSARGSLAGRLAHLFMNEVVDGCEIGLDLHTGSNGRTNLPQIRAQIRDRRTRELAEAFGAPVMINARDRSGSLRQVATRRGARVLVYEGGEAGRFDRVAISVGTDGVLRVLAHLKMMSARHVRKRGRQPLAATGTIWIRASRGGILSLDVQLGESVVKGQQLGEISDAFHDKVLPVRSSESGLVIGITTNPIVNRGDAVAHLAW